MSTASSRAADPAHIAEINAKISSLKDSILDLEADKLRKQELVLTLPNEIISEICMKFILDYPFPPPLTDYLASQFEVSQYLITATVAAYIWDIGLNLRNDYPLLFEPGFASGPLCIFFKVTVTQAVEEDAASEDELQGDQYDSEYTLEECTNCSEYEDDSVERCF
ncbi:hypothetical protein C8R45DRAFT_946121 [Mycena sanguinolenta]|nr:hypothetical protein C8R45DRAFT_946121 [Mycena sanguinolenta]